jgi:hypothetical protein
VPLEGDGVVHWRRLDAGVARLRIVRTLFSVAAAVVAAVLGVICAVAVKW